MSWFIERVTPVADGNRVNFTISYTPVDGTELMFFPGMPNERVFDNPIEAMQYMRNGTNVTFGIAPANGRTPFVRYFTDEA
jgi:hypothetical protein